MAERKPELTVVDTLKDRHGRTVKVGYRGADVEVIVTPHSGHDGRMSFDGEQRQQFAKAWDDAARQARQYAARDARADVYEASRAQGRDKVESMARALIGIPDGL